jgi:hypothetical protein
MANRKLLSMGFDKILVDVMTKKGFTSSENLLGRPTIDVLYDLDLPLPTLQDIIRIVSVKIAPKARTAKEILDEKNSDSSPLSTLLALDSFLRGGLHTGTLTEVVGPPSIGG